MKLWISRFDEFGGSKVNKKKGVIVDVSNIENWKYIYR